MKLQFLMNELEVTSLVSEKVKNMEISGIADNSLETEKNFLFVAVQGFNSDGHQFIDEAIKNGASVVIGEKEIHDLSISYIQVKDSRKALGIIAKRYYNNPSKNKLLVGITGTNGKTTTSYLLKHILEKNGLSCSLIGTIQNIINGKTIQCMNTTPGPLVLQKLLSQSKDEVVIMEVSSHSLVQFRVEGLEYDYCLFTNLTHEHLDYHSSMEEYFKAKVSLFEKLKVSGHAIVNADDSWGNQLIHKLQNERKTVYKIGFSKGTDFRIVDFNLGNSTGTINENNKLSRIYSPMTGSHNLYNMAMAYATARLLKIEAERISSSLESFHGVEGRFEISKLFNGATVVIDYAHTPEAIFHCLRTARISGAKRLIHIFGFRGDRDSSKRRDMLAISAELSDQYILTFDDLNSVSKREMAETLKSLHTSYGNDKGTIVLDRTLALKKAIEESKQGDWILITGKGHEKYQQNFHIPSQTDKGTVTYITNRENP